MDGSKPGGGVFEGDILALLDARVRRIAEEVAREVGSARAPIAGDLVDGETRRQVAEQLLLSNKNYLTRVQVAVYLCVSERSIKEWSARPADQNPFPEVRAGADPRYKRTAVDDWAEAEARRQRLRLAG
jgi:hypothetical protein